MHCMPPLRLVAMLGALMIFNAPRFAAAECIPTEDACAPKKIKDAWEKSVNLGFNMTSGNSETTLFVFGGRLSKETDHTLWNFNAAYSFGEAETKDTDSEETKKDTTRNDFRGAAQYSYLFDNSWYSGFGTSVLYDEIADIDYRVILNPTGGHYLLNDNSFKLRLEGGPSYVFERVGVEDNDYLAPRLADRFEWAITCTSKLFQQSEVLFDVTDSDNILLNNEVGAEAALATDLALVLTVRDQFDNVPAPGKEKNDLTVISSLKISL